MDLLLGPAFHKFYATVLNTHLDPCAMHLDRQPDRQQNLSGLSMDMVKKV